MKNICANCHKECDKLLKLMCRVCYNKNRKFGDPNYSRAAIPNILTEQQINVIIGSILGDGYLRRKKISWNASLYIVRAQHDYEYLVWESKVLDNLLTPTGITKFDRYDNRTNKIYHACAFNTRHLTALNSFHNDWYQNKIKTIPNNLRLNAEIIAVWFCDDGSIGTSSSANRLKISFATNSFSKEEVYFLRELLNDRYNENFTISCRHDIKKEQYVIHGSDAATRTLISDIDSVFPDGMERKRLWDKPESCFYENVPIKRQSSQASSSEKKYKILEYLQTHNEFYLNDLGRYAGFAFDRKSRNGDGEIASSNIQRHYLNEFLADKLIIKIGRSKDNYRKGVKYQLTETGKEYFDNIKL